MKKHMLFASVVMSVTSAAYIVDAQEQRIAMPQIPALRSAQAFCIEKGHVPSHPTQLIAMELITEPSNSKLGQPPLEKPQSLLDREAAEKAEKTKS